MDFSPDSGDSLSGPASWTACCLHSMTLKFSLSTVFSVLLRPSLLAPYPSLPSSAPQGVWVCGCVRVSACHSAVEFLHNSVLATVPALLDPSICTWILDRHPPRTLPVFSPSAERTRLSLYLQSRWIFVFNPNHFFILAFTWSRTFSCPSWR